MPEANRNKPTMPLLRQKVGTERVKEFFKEATDKNGVLIDGVMYDDIDKEFTNEIENKFEIIDNYDSKKKVPVYFYNIQRWTEYQTSWENTDKNSNIKLPFISVIRQPNPQPGTQRDGYYNIPGKRHYELCKVPTFDGNREGMDLYKVPQPMPVDIEYHVKLFTYQLELLNDFNTKFLDKYKSLEHYIKPKGLWMKTTLESIDDESQLSNIDSRKYYVQTVKIKICGYILDPKDFIIEKSITRVITDMVIGDKTGGSYSDKPFVKSGLFTQSIDFNKSINEISFKATSDYVINSFNFDYNIYKIDVVVDNSLILSNFTNGTIEPIEVVKGDKIIIRISKSDIIDKSKITLYCQS